MDGLDVCRQLRESSDVPIIVVTARGEEVDRVVGLELGADDYVVKPFGLRELIARIRAVARRSEKGRARDGAHRIGGLEIDERRRGATMDGAPLDLTPKEFDLLLALARDPGAVVSRRRLLEEVWNTTWSGSTKTIDVHVAALRRKLGDPDPDRDRARGRFSPAGMSRRVLFGVLGLVVVVLAALEIPLGVQNARTARRDRNLEGRTRCDRARVDRPDGAEPSVARTGPKRSRHSHTAIDNRPAVAS